MPLFDLPHAELERYAPARDEPPDFDAFWRMTLDEARRHPLHASFAPAEAGLTTLEVFDVSFNGFGGQAIKGWLLLPRGHAPGLPCLVEYVGYGGGRGFPHEWLLWSSAGYAHLVMDTRGQGSDGRTGDTPDHDPAMAGPHFPGFMTRGILDPVTYYYRRVMTDAARAIEAARSHPAVDPDRVGVIGRSQGGGLALAAAALDPAVSLMAADVPFLCHYRRATHLVASHPYAEISNYCRTHREKVETVFRTLAYFDGVNFAARCRAPALFSAGLMDTVCPPSTVYAAYNHYAGPKHIETWEYNSHDGGGPHHVQTRLDFFREVWRSAQSPAAKLP